MSSEHDVRMSTVHKDVSRSAFIMSDRDPLGSSMSKTAFVCVQRSGLSARARIFSVYLCAGCAFVSKHVRCVRDTVHSVVQCCSLTMSTGCAQSRDTDFLSEAIFCLRAVREYPVVLYVLRSRGVRARCAWASRPHRRRHRTRTPSTAESPTPVRWWR